MAAGGVHSLMIPKALDLSLGTRHSTSGVSRVYTKHFGLFALWGLRLMEPTGPIEQVICITPWPWVLAGHSHIVMHLISIPCTHFIHTVFMMNTIRDVCGRFNHSLCKHFLVGNCWLNEYMCEGGGEKGCKQHNITCPFQQLITSLAR